MGNYRTLGGALSRAMSVAVFVAGTLIPSLALANNNAGLRTIPLHISNHLNQTRTCTS